MGNIVVKEEKADYQHYLSFPTMFSEGFFPRVVWSRDWLCGKELSKIYAHYVVQKLSF